MLRLTALLTGVALLLTGSGLLGTLLAVSGGEAGFGAGTLGLVMSGYFAGFFMGTFFAPSLIGRIGHIRAFAFFAALAAIAVLLHPLWLNAWLWGLLRIITGIALVGLYTVIESWLNAEPDPRQRSLCWVLVEEVRAADWLCGGGNLHAQAIPCIVTVKVPAGVLDEPLRRDYVQALHQAIAQCVEPQDERLLMTSIQLEEVADGTWGANGSLWHLADFTRAAGYGHLLARG